MQRSLRAVPEDRGGCSGGPGQRASSVTGPGRLPRAPEKDIVCIAVAIRGLGGSQGCAFQTTDRDSWEIVPGAPVCLPAEARRSLASVASSGHGTLGSVLDYNGRTFRRMRRAAASDDGTHPDGRTAALRGAPILVGVGRRDGAPRLPLLAEGSRHAGHALSRMSSAPIPTTAKTDGGREVQLQAERRSP